MTSHPVVRMFAAALLAAALSACASVEPGPAVATVDPTTSVAQADARLAAVAAERAAIEARYAEREAVCYDKFFVNHCLDEAKERRRVALNAQRNIEIEAERFKRRMKVEERDREIAAAEAEYKAEEARLAAEPPPAPARRWRRPTRLPQARLPQRCALLDDSSWCPFDQAMASAAPRRSASMYSRDCISMIRETVRWNSFASIPWVYSSSGSTAADMISLTLWS